MDIEVKVDAAQWKQIETALAEIPKAIPKAAAAAINKTLAKGRTQINRRIAVAIGVPVRRLGKRIKALKATAQNLIGKIRFYSFNIPAIFTKTKPAKGGIYPTRIGGDGHALPNTPFKQTMKSGHLGWFVRVGPKPPPRKGGRPKQKVEQVYVAGPQRVWEESPSIASEEIATLQTDLQKQIESQIDRFLK